MKKKLKEITANGKCSKYFVIIKNAEPTWYTVCDIACRKNKHNTHYTCICICTMSMKRDQKETESHHTR